MLEVFYGEFLTSPAPLQLSLNYCSFGCQYCFANRKSPHRTARIPSIMNLIKECNERKTLAAFLLREKYPVLISNLVDPFAHSNYQQSVPIMRTLVEMEVPIAFQTRAGIHSEGVNKTLDFIQPSVWYCSLDTLDDTIRRCIQPGAPSIQDRLALMEHLVKLGHTLIVGLNPCVPQWAGDIQQYVKTVKDVGAEAVWVATLHFSPREGLGQFSPKEIESMGEEVLLGSMGKHTEQEQRVEEYFFAIRDEITRQGLMRMSMGQPETSDVPSLFARHYPKRFPVFQDFVNACFEQSPKERALLQFKDYCRYFLPLLPEGEWELAHYFNSRTAWKKWKMPSKFSYAELLRIMWHDQSIKNSLLRSTLFAYAGEPQGKGWVQNTDEDGHPYMVFDPNEHSDYWTVWENK